jgi:CheY-like chemotaxis protein
MGRKILTDAGYEVVAVNNGSAALKKIIEQKPDLIVLDVYMPGYSGLEVCQRIKENRDTARIPVLLTVGKLEPFKPEEARRARADAFVVKPFEASELLTAVTKLEEKIAPQPEPYKPGRFAKAIASLDEPESAAGEKFGDSESGWKARLRFPGKKKKAEPEEAPEIPAPAAPVRDFRDEAPSTSPVASKPASSAHEFERPMPAGIPRDITPEEIAAISAAAARLSGAPVPPASEAAPAVGPSAESVAAAPVISAEAQPATPAAPELAAASPDLPAMADLAPITFASAPVLDDEKSAEEKLEEKIAAEKSPEPVAPESVLPAVSEPSTPLPAPDVERVATPEPPVPVGQAADVPSASADAPTQADVLPTTVVSESRATFDVVPESVTEQATAVESVVQSEAAPQPIAEAPSEVRSEVESPVATAASQDVQAEAHAESVPVQPVEVAAGIPAAESAITPAPAPAAQDEEVMAALQNLIPANGDAAGPSSESSSSLLATVAEFAHGGGPSSRPRWIFEEAVVTADEAALSLEQEMEKAYASFAASEAARLLATSALDSLTPAQPSTVAAAIVEQPASTVEAPPFADSANEGANTEIVSAPPAFTEAVAQSTEAPAVHAMASAAGAGEGGISIPTASASAEPASAAFEPQVAPIDSAVSDVSARAVEQPAETVRSVVTDFQVAAASASISGAELAPDDSQSPVSAEAVVASPDASFETISAGDDDIMGKNSESTGFKMIRQSPAGAKPAPASVTKENFDAAAVAEPAAMAAAASAETAPVPPMPATAPDPRAIASIVDSVLAELRPKIVEEIAKKLTDPNK